MSGFYDYSKPNSSQTSTNQWGTPPQLIRKFEQAVGEFDVDPCSGCEPEPIAETRYTKEDDGLSQPWHGTVWCNPPYSDIGPWLKKAYTETHNGDADLVFCLIPVRTSASWFHEWGTRSDILTFVEGRLHFVRPSGGNARATFSNMICAYGSYDDSVLQTCQSLGFTVTDNGVYSQTSQTTLTGAVK